LLAKGVTKVLRMRLIILAILTLVLLVSAGCGDEVTLVVSTGNGIIIYTTYSSNKALSGQGD